MPIYTYKCTRCHRRQEELRSMYRRELLATCNICGYLAEPEVTKPAPPRFSIAGVRGHFSRTAGGGKSNAS